MRKTATLWLAPPLALLTTLSASLVNADAADAAGLCACARDTLARGALDALTGAAVWLLLCAFYARALSAASGWTRGERAKRAALSLFFALVLALRPIYAQGEEALGALTAPGRLLLIALKLVGWGAFFDAGIGALSAALSRPRAQAAPDDRALRRLFLLAWAAILLCWLPGWLVRWPAVLNNDESRALQMVFGEAPLTDDHPYAYTLLLSAFLRLGLAMGDANLGAALFAAAQATFLSGALAFTAREMARRGAPRWAWLSACALYAAGPLFARFGFVILKDVLYSAAFTGYVIALCRAFERPEGNRPAPRWLAALLVFSAMLLLLRHNGKMVVYPTTLLLAAKLWKGARPKRRAAQTALLLSPVLAALLFNALVVSPVAIHVDSGANVMGVALQQLARVARYAPEDVSEGERAAIDRVIEYDAMGESYAPRSSDPVRKRYRYFEARTAADWADFTKAWLSVSARNPLSAFHAFYALNGGYLDPLADGTAFLNDMEPPTSGKYVQALGLNHPEWTAAARARLYSLEELWRALPPVALLSNVGAYVWALLVAWLLVRRTPQRHLAWLLLPSGMTLLACLLSAGFGSCGRYAFPIVYTAPLLLATLLRPNQQYRS